MTTYNSYEAAKIANPECAIFEYKRNFGTDKEILDLFDIQSREMKECCPADHCMTIEKFLADGHKFAEGDIALIHNGDVKTVVNPYLDWNTPNPDDNKRYILRAAALEEKPSEKVEWENGDECVYNGINWLFCGFHPTNGLAIVADNDSPALHHLVTVDIELLSKPETQQQREDRERLEAAYDLYCYVSERSGRAPFSIEYFTRSNEHCYKDEYLAIVDKTNYRKEGK
jgi:hypothetical protein